MTAALDIAFIILLPTSQIRVLRGYAQILCICLFDDLLIILIPMSATIIEAMTMPPVNPYPMTCPIGVTMLALVPSIWRADQTVHRMATPTMPKQVPQTPPPIKNHAMIFLIIILTSNK